jgi:hypothetical protein
MGIEELRICDFFSGLHSWTNVYDLDNVNLFSIDNNPEYELDTTLIKDFLDLTANHVLDYFDGKKPHVIYASPPCTTFSVASIGHHWTGGSKAYIPKTEASKKGLEIVKHLNTLILELNPDLVFIENPRGILRKLNLFGSIPGIQLHTIWQCQYGYIHGIKRAKPTDIWTNSKKWKPRPVCKNGSLECDHVRAPRGAKTGTQGLPNNQIRSLIPFELCSEIKDAILEELKDVIN